LQDEDVGSAVIGHLVYLRFGAFAPVGGRARAGMAWMFTRAAAARGCGSNGVWATVAMNLSI